MKFLPATFALCALAAPLSAEEYRDIHLPAGIRMTVPRNWTTSPTEQGPEIAADPSLVLRNHGPPGGGSAGAGGEGSGYLATWENVPILSPDEEKEAMKKDRQAAEKALRDRLAKGVSRRGDLISYQAPVPLDLPEGAGYRISCVVCKSFQPSFRRPPAKPPEPEPVTAYFIRSGDKALTISLHGPDCDKIGASLDFHGMREPLKRPVLRSEIVTAGHRLTLPGGLEMQIPYGWTDLYPTGGWGPLTAVDGSIGLFTAPVAADPQTIFTSSDPAFPDHGIEISVCEPKATVEEIRATLTPEKLRGEEGKQRWKSIQKELDRDGTLLDLGPLMAVDLGRAAGLRMDTVRNSPDGQSAIRTRILTTADYTFTIAIRLPLADYPACAALMDDITDSLRLPPGYPAALPEQPAATRRLILQPDGLSMDIPATCAVRAPFLRNDMPIEIAPGDPSLPFATDLPGPGHARLQVEPASPRSSVYYNSFNPPPTGWSPYFASTGPKNSDDGTVQEQPLKTEMSGPLGLGSVWGGQLREIRTGPTGPVVIRSAFFKPYLPIVTLTYPVAERSYWDPIADRMWDSIKMQPFAGDLMVANSEMNRTPAPVCDEIRLVHGISISLPRDWNPDLANGAVAIDPLTPERPASQLLRASAASPRLKRIKDSIFWIDDTGHRDFSTAELRTLTPEQLEAYRRQLVQSNATLEPCDRKLSLQFRVVPIDSCEGIESSYDTCSTEGELFHHKTLAVNVDDGVTTFHLAYPARAPEAWKKTGEGILGSVRIYEAVHPSAN